MTKRSAPCLGSLVLMALVAAACEEGSSPSVQPAPERFAQELTPGPITRPHEAPFREIADDVPGFAGFSINAEGLVDVLLVGDADRDHAADAVAKYFAGRSRESLGSLRSRVRFRTAQYRFVDLADWRDSITTDILLAGVEGVSSVDFAEDRNRIVIGILPDANRSAVIKKIADLGIPQAAVELTSEEYAQLDRAIAYYPSHTYSRFDTIVAGIRHTFWDGSDYFYCTLGPTVPGGFLTTSHCTEDEWRPDGANIWQNGLGNPSDVIGHETDDPLYSRSGTRCNPPCRYSDAALHEYTSTRHLGLGLVVEPADSSRTAGTTLVNQNSIGFPLDGELSNPVLGDVVQKVGEATGWTYGSVTKTCKDTKVKKTDWPYDYYLLCQDFATYGRQDGDSGAPVFIDMGYGYYLVGMHSGNSSDGEAIFSAVANIENDLQINFTFGPYPH